MVSHSLIFQSVMRVSISSIAGANAAVAASTSSSVQPAPGRSSARMNPTSTSTRGYRYRRGLDRDVLEDLHLVEQVPVVGFVDAHHLLHRLRRQADLVTDHPGALGDPLADVDQLDLVGVNHVDVGVFVGQRGDRDPGALGLSQVGSQFVTPLNAEHPRDLPSFDAAGSVAPDPGNSITCSSMTGQEYDVVVVGSGAAGMVAALTAAHRAYRRWWSRRRRTSAARPLDPAAACGSRTTRSSNVTASPTRPRPRAPICTASSATSSNPRRIDTYLDRGPEMLSFVLKHTPLKMCWVPGYSDYYPETPGGRPGGRSIEPKPFNAKKLGPDESGLEPAYGKVPLNVVVMQQDYVRLNMLKRHPRGVLRSLKVGARTMWAKATGKNLVGMGRALIAPAADRAAQGRCAGAAQHRADRSVRRGRRRARRLRPRYGWRRKALSRS